MFTLIMGTLALKCALLIYRWMSIHMAVVTVALIVLVKIKTIKQKYFIIIKSLYTHRVDKQGFIKQRDWDSKGETTHKTANIKFNQHKPKEAINLWNLEHKKRPHQQRA